MEVQLASNGTHSINIVVDSADLQGIGINSGQPRTVLDMWLDSFFGQVLSTPKSIILSVHLYWPQSVGLSMGGFARLRELGSIGIGGPFGRR
jgi:hypothetical protein